MNRVKKQHFVPQHHLRKFALDEQVFVYDKATKISSECNIKDVCSENYFYDMPSDIEAELGIDQIVEKGYGELETVQGPAIAAVLDKLKSTIPLKLTSDERAHIAGFIVFQAARTRKQRNYIKENITEFAHRQLSESWREKTGTSLPPIKLEMKKEYTPIFHALSTAQPDRLIEIGDRLMELIWFFCVNSTRHPFYTSDAPVFFNNDVKDPSFFGFVPLSPEVLLHIGTPLGLADSLDSELVKRERGRVAEIGLNEVQYYNTAQILNAHRQIISPNDASEFIQTILTH